METERRKIELTGPKSLTRTVEADGDRVKFTYEGVAANGNAISYTFSVVYDGKDYPIQHRNFRGIRSAVPSGIVKITP